MRSGVVVVANEAPMLLEQMRLQLVRFVESFNLATCRWPANTGRNMLNSQVSAVNVKSRDFSPRRLKLGSLISENLFWSPIPFNGSIKQQHSVLSRWIPDLNRASDESGAVIQVADHPKVVIAQFEVSLPEAVAVFSLETLRSPRLSRCCNRVI